MSVIGGLQIFILSTSVIPRVEKKRKKDEWKIMTWSSSVTVQHYDQHIELQGLEELPDLPHCVRGRVPVHPGSSGSLSTHGSSPLSYHCQTGFQNKN